MFESFVELFHIVEDLFSRETAIWMFIALILILILQAISATGVPDKVVKKTGKDKWTIFKFR